MRRSAALLARRLTSAAGASSSLGLTEAYTSGQAALGLRQVSSSSVVRWPTHIEDELYCRQRNILVLGNRIPFLAPDAWVAPNAIVVGDVDLFDGASHPRSCRLFSVVKPA